MRTFNIILLIFLALIVGYLLGFYISVDVPWSQTATMFLIITLAGAFGGLLYTVRDSGLEFPHRNPDKIHVLNLGWIADCAYGIAGSYVVFLILPTDLNIDLSTGKILDLIKLLALALVGGYGGRSLVDRALANIAKDAEEAKQSAQETKEKMIQIQDLDTSALELVHRHLDEDEGELDIQPLKEAIIMASRAARFEIFKEARAVRSANWKKNVPLMERTIPIFEALIDNKEGEQFHRNHGQLGYALKDQGGSDDTKKDWNRAYQELTKAIDLRDQGGIEGFSMYQFNRALCGIKLDKAFDSIEHDIQATARNHSLHKKMKQIDLITTWAKQNQYDLEALKKKAEK